MKTVFAWSVQAEWSANFFWYRLKPFPANNALAAQLLGPSGGGRWGRGRGAGGIVWEGGAV